MSVPSPPWQGLVCFLALSFEVSHTWRSDCLRQKPPPAPRLYLLRLPDTFPRVEGPLIGMLISLHGIYLFIE